MLQTTGFAAVTIWICFEDEESFEADKTDMPMDMSYNNNIPLILEVIQDNVEQMLRHNPSRSTSDRNHRSVTTAPQSMRPDDEVRRPLLANPQVDLTSKAVATNNKNNNPILQPSTMDDNSKDDPTNNDFPYTQGLRGPSIYQGSRTMNSRSSNKHQMTSSISITLHPIKLQP